MFLRSRLRKFLVPMFFGAVICSYSQMGEPPDLYGGVGYYRHTGFDDNSYYHIRLGAQIFSYRFIAPEVDFTYYFGGNNRIGERDSETNLPISRLFKNFRGRVWGLAPKFYYGDIDSRIVFIPKYNFGTVSSEGIVDTSFGQSTALKTDSRLSFWSFSIGFEDSLDSERFKFGFYLTYTDFNAGKSLNQISFPSFGFQNSDIDTGTLGLNIRVSYSLWDSDDTNDQ